MTRKAVSLLRRHEPHREGIHAVPRIFFGHHLALKYVSEMSVAVRALDLDAIPVGIFDAFHCSGNLLIEARPAAARIKLVIGSIELGVALAADVRAPLGEIVILSRKWRLRSLVFDHVAFLRGQLVVLHAGILSSEDPIAQSYDA